MGGNAMKSFGVTRLNKTQYNELTNAIKLTFKDLLENSEHCYRLAIIPSYRNKESFGDCDLLSYMPNEIFEKELTNNKDFKILGKKQNGNVISYAVKFKNLEPFQIDLIKTNSYNFDFNLNYLSYNDLGNLIGRIAAALGFKFAHDGLYIQAWFSHNGTPKNIEKVKENGKTNEHAEYKKECLFLSDFQKAIELLGFNYNRFCKGFDELEDIIEYVANSKYFCKDYFALENRNHIQRMRDKKRTTYSAALKYFENLKNRDRSTIKAEFKKTINSQFPQIATIRHKMKKECKHQYIISKRLKTSRIKWLTKKHFGITLEGITLGNMMKAIKSSCDKTAAANGALKSIWNSHLTELIGKNLL